MGDDHDLDALVRTYHDRLVRLAYVCCGDATEAEDIVADAYAHTWPRLRRGRVEEPLTYLRRSVVNGAVSYRRHRFVVRREELRHRVAAPPAISAEHGLAERDLLLTALRSLPAHQLQVVALRFLEDLSEEETATTLSIPVGTVKSRCARALRSLRAAIAEPDDEEEAAAARE